MKYFVQFFAKNGQAVKKQFSTMKTHKQVVLSVQKYVYSTWEHALVVNEKFIAKRYDKNGKLIKTTPRYFKSTDGKDWFTIVVMLGNKAEVHRFGNPSKRDEAFEKACMTSIPAASVETVKEPNDTTVFLDEMFDSKNGSTSKKISNGSALNVTWMEGLILFPTVVPSGSVSADDSVKIAWSTGSVVYPSKRRRIFATVKTLPEIEGAPYPGLNEHMKRMEGKTIEVKKTQVGQFTLYHGARYFWREDWLDFRHATLQVKPDARMAPSYLNNYKGKTLSFLQCSDHWKTRNYCFKARWLQIPRQEHKGEKTILMKSWGDTLKKTFSTSVS